MPSAALQPESAWAEDRALLRSNPSADPGAEVGVGVQHRWTSLPFLLRSWHQRAKPSRQDAATAPAGCPSPLANSHRSTFQFPLNQDSLHVRLTASLQGKWDSASLICLRSARGSSAL
jgi:hypothetical protein